MMDRIVSNGRRNFCTLAGGSVLSLVLGSSCRRDPATTVINTERLTARPGVETRTSASGKSTLGLDSSRDAILQVPNSAPGTSVPLLVMLHGAGQSADDMFWYLGSAPEQAGVAVLAPNSRDHTWDAIGGYFGPDVQFLDRALQLVFQRVNIDPKRIALGGFSDGASYAISLGIINGDLFNRVVAFSPGFIVDGGPTGKPQFFISHGRSDKILPINSCGRRIVLDLKGRGYEVMFHEFEGGHEIPEEIAREGLAWVSR